MPTSLSNSPDRSSRGARFTVGVFTLGVVVGAVLMGWLSPSDASPGSLGSGEAESTGSGSAFDVIGESFFAVRVDDARAATDWYRSRLGLTTANELDDPDGRFVIRILSRPGLIVELIEQSGTPAPPDRAPTGHFKAGFFVADVDAAFEALRSQGVDTDDGVSTDDALGVRMFVFRDLEGNRLQIFGR